MEFYIRPFLDTFPGPVMDRLALWTGHPNYHVRRLVSEGTRPKLPWAKRIDLDPMSPVPLLAALRADPTRYVTRSVANHLNDLAKTHPDAVVALLRDWREEHDAVPAELDWMTRHALRTLVKQGHGGALATLGYDPEAEIAVTGFTATTEAPRIGEATTLSVTLTAARPTPVLVDYVIWFRRPGGRESAKVHKMKTATIPPDRPLRLAKTHHFKSDATTFTLVPGAHRVALQVNGRRRAEIVLALRPG
jgi:3-methyladenine DNA glycosylase AlkC